jgi:pimeloyl-ACP methyl ester carboxylesterase
VLAAIDLLFGCDRTRGSAPPPAASTSATTTIAVSAPDAGVAATDDATTDGELTNAERETGPFDIPFDGTRNVYVVAPTSPKNPQRLIAFLHGICNPPEYACGLWTQTSTQLGFLVCPTGDARCGPGQYNAPTWGKPEGQIDVDLEHAIDATIARFPDAITRDDAVLCGFSRGAYMAVKFASAHPGRWPYLVLNEANVTLSVEQLKKAKVRAVALIAGELGGQIGGERKTAATLAKQGFPARFWPMPKAGHFYSDDIAQIMKEAIEFVTAVPAPP